MPATIAGLLRNNWFALRDMPTRLAFIPVMPTWYTAGERALWNVGVLIALGCSWLGMRAADKLWRHLVIKRYRWTTEEEVRAFFKRMI